MTAPFGMKGLATVRKNADWGGEREYLTVHRRPFPAQSLYDRRVYL